MQKIRTAFLLTTALALTGCETPIGQSWNNTVSRFSSQPADDSDTRNGLTSDRPVQRRNTGTTFLGPKPENTIGTPANTSGPVPLKPFRSRTRSTAPTLQSTPQPTPRVTLQGKPTATPRPSPKPSVTPKPTPKPVVEETEPEVKPTPAESNEPPPFASPVPGKKGYVTSPYSPAAGFIDVTGLEPGSLAKDPYSGKVFRVP